MTITKVTEDVRELGADEVSGANLGIVGQAAGDMMYFDGTLWLPVPAGVEGDVVTMVGGVPLFIPPPLAGVVLLQSLSFVNTTPMTIGDPAGAAHFADARFKKFIVEGYDFFQSGGGSTLWARFGTGPTGVQQNTNYRWRADNITANGPSGESRAGSTTTDAQMQLHSTLNDNPADSAQTFKLELQNPNSPTFNAQMRGFWEGPTTASTHAASRMFGTWLDNTPITSLDLLMSNGVGMWGEIRLYGVRDAL